MHNASAAPSATAAGTADLALRVRDLGKRYNVYEKPQDRLKQMLWRKSARFHDEFWAVRDVNFEVRRGETVGIVGRNGSGKSTLLQMICGTVSPTTGTVERNGRISALLELGSGFNVEFTGRENVYLNGSLLGMTRQEVDARFERIAAFADIGSFIDSPVKHYSSGMFARLAFSVAVHVDPDILIVDEILAVGDAAFQRRCLQKFYEIRESGCTILFVSHDQYQVKSVCQRALYLERGMQRMFGDAGRVIDQYTVDTEAQLAASAPVAASPDAATTAEPTQPRSPGEVAHAAGSPAVSQAAAIGEVEAAAAPPIEPAAFLFAIEDVRLTSEEGEDLAEVESGRTVVLTMRFRCRVRQPPERISFVFNLYRHDGLYICGTTTLMEGMQPHPGGRSGRVQIRFPDLPLLSGRYKWRVAINDHGGFVVLAEAKEVCPFVVVDRFDAVGLVSLPREWRIHVDP